MQSVALKIDPNLFAPPEVEKCEGLVYRCRVSHYLDSQGCYVETVKFVPLRRKSCTGCEQCGYLLDDLRERLDPKYIPSACTDIVDAGEYRLAVTNVSIDPWSGHADDFDIEFVRIKPEDGAKNESKPK